MPYDAPAEEGEGEMKEGGKRCKLRTCEASPQIHHQEVRGDIGTGEQVRDKVVRVSALGAGRGGDAASHWRGREGSGTGGCGEWF